MNRRSAPAAAAGLASLALLAGSLAASAPTPDPAALAALRARVELAEEPGFHLLLDPDARELQLRFGGIPLRIYPAGALAIGVPKVAFVPRPDAGPAPLGRIWRGGALFPPRVMRPLRIRPGEDPEAVVPLPPEEAVPAPPTFEIRFAGGLVLEVVPSGTDRGAGGWLRTRAAALAGWLRGSAAPRLRLVADPSVSAELYRSLPPAVSLLVLPPAARETRP